MNIDQLLDRLAGDMEMSVAGPQIVGAPQAAQVSAWSTDFLLAGFPATSIATVTTQDITFNPARPIRAKHLFLGTAARVALSRVNAITVNAVNQNIGNGPVPGDLFTSDQTFSLKGDTIEPGNGATLNITNGTGGTVIYEGAFIGPALIAQRPGG